MKVCTKCNCDETLVSFYKGRRVCKKCFYVYTHAHRKANKDKRSVSDKKYNEKTKEKYRPIRAALTREWRKTHPESDQINHHTRRARLENKGSFSKEEWLTLLLCTGGACLGCGSLEPVTMDHVVPISRGGSNTIDNIQPLCLSCNLSKGVKSTDYR